MFCELEINDILRKSQVFELNNTYLNNLQVKEETAKGV